MKNHNTYKNMDSIRRTHVPYCVQKQPNGSYILLNRNYEPLGFLGEFNSERDSKNFEFYFARMTAITAAKISWNNNPDVDKIFLYNDRCTPTLKEEYINNYFVRLEHLMRLKIKYR